MTCSSCEYLKENKKVDGASSGTKYYCSKYKKYVYGCNDKCEKFSRSIIRSNMKCDEIYNKGLIYSDDTHSVSYYITLLIFILIFVFIIFITNGDLYF